MVSIRWYRARRNGPAASASQTYRRRPQLKRNVMSTSRIDAVFPAVNYRTWLLGRSRTRSQATSSSPAPITRRASTQNVNTRRSRSVPAGARWCAREHTFATDSSATIKRTKSDGTLDRKRRAPRMENPATIYQVGSRTTESHLSEETLAAQTADDKRNHNIAMPARCSSDSGDACTICVTSFNEEDNIRGLTCGHAFHVECIDRWFRDYRACCPTCMVDYAT